MEDELLEPEIVNSRVVKYYKDNNELLTPEQIKRLNGMGYDDKTIYYSTYDQIKQMRQLLEEAAIKDSINLAIQSKQLSHLSNIETIAADHRNIVADDIVRRHKEQCDKEIWAAERMANQAKFRFWFVLIFGYLMIGTFSLAWYVPLHHDGAAGIEAMKIIFPLFNLIP
jgi:hypothetical protein